MKLKVRHYFDAAHKLEDTKDLVTKECANLHGHTYAVIVEAENKLLNSAGMVIDFKAIKQAIDILDHTYINNVFNNYDLDIQPTAENIAMFIAELVEDLDSDLKVTKVSVCEGYKGEDRASWAIWND